MHTGGKPTANCTYITVMNVSFHFPRIVLFILVENQLQIVHLILYYFNECSLSLPQDCFIDTGGKSVANCTYIIVMNASCHVPRIVLFILVELQLVLHVSVD
jgi:hypothetical protein